MTTEPPNIVLNEATHRFEWTVDGHTAYEVFERFPGGIAYLLWRGVELMGWA